MATNQCTINTLFELSMLECLTISHTRPKFERIRDRAIYNQPGVYKGAYDMDTGIEVFTHMVKRCAFGN